MVSAREAEPSGAVSLAHAVKAHLLLVVLVAFVAANAAALWLTSRPATYEATAEMLVTPAPDDGGADSSVPLLRTSGDRTRIMQTAASLVDSAGAERLTARTMGSGWTPDRVSGAVTVEPIGQSDVLAVVGREHDPTVAARLANTFVQAALEARVAALRPRIQSLVSQLEAELRAQRDPGSPLAVDLAERLSELRALPTDRDPTLSLSRGAEIPAAPVGAPSWLLVALACLAGLVVGVGAALAVELIGPARVADGAEATLAAGSPVLAQIPVRRGGGLRVRTAWRGVQLQFDAYDPPRRVLLLASPSSSAEAAGCVADFGATLADAGHEVLLLDLDVPAGPLAARLGVDPPLAPPPAAQSWDRAAGGQPWERALAPVAGRPGLKLLPAGHWRPAEADAIDVAGVLSWARHRFDYVLVNAPPLAESGEALRVVRAVDAVVLLVQPGHTRRQDLHTAVGLLERTRGHPDGLLVLGGRQRRRRGEVPPAPAPASEARAAPRAVAERGP